MKVATPPVVLVTGCASGIGRASVEALAAAGCHVVATARDPTRMQDLAGPRTQALPLDVTDAQACRAVVEDVLQRHGRIDALVNNAGFGATLAVEDTPDEVARRMFDTNVHAPIALARLVLPQMRAQGSGRIVNVASVAGHVAVPLLGTYCATKFALRALTRAMDNEVRPLGVRALLVEPGVIRTHFGTRSQAETEAAAPHDARLAGPYGAKYATWERRRFEGRGAPPRLVARQIVHACTARRPRLHYRAPWSAKAAVVAQRLLPEAWLDAGFRAYFR